MALGFHVSKTKTAAKCFENVVVGIDAPVIDSQNRPSTNGDSMTAILAAAKGHYQMLYAVLAGGGPLRAGEALGLEVGKHTSPDFRTLYVMQKAKRGEIQPYLKTKNGSREVDLCVDLAAKLKEYVGERTEGLLFRTSSGAQLLQTNCSGVECGVSH